MSSPTDSAPEEKDNVLETAAGLLAEGEIDVAAGTLFDAWSADPGNRDLAVSYASLLAQVGRGAEAEELFACLADEMPDDGRVWNNWGYLLLTRGEADIALAKLGRALELSPRDFEATVNMGIALDRLGRTTEALDFHRQAAEINPNSPVVF
ncbi:MAG: tetratricopeptide repeat protein, partial [Planctomycetota bacterium]|nr:tetratricopeptide repeat protein [Planctomycetota bacterium]